MNARILTLLTASLLTIASAFAGTTKGGDIFLNGSWAGYNAPDGPGSTGGILFLTGSSTPTNTSSAAAAAVTRSPVSGYIDVPNLRTGVVESI